VIAGSDILKKKVKKVEKIICYKGKFFSGYAGRLIFCSGFEDMK